MVLNYIWIAFFLIAFVVALCKLAIGGDTEVFTHIINASFLLRQRQGSRYPSD